jgi:hypothetical protein
VTVSSCTSSAITALAVIHIVAKVNFINLRIEQILNAYD